MDYIAEEKIEVIYQGSNFYIGSYGGSQWKTFYLITVSEGIVSRKIGIRLSKDEVQQIINSNGDERIVQQIKMSNLGYIDILPEEKKSKSK